MSERVVNVSNRLIKLLVSVGCALVFVGVSLLAISGVQAQSDAPDFVGAKECASCHRNLARDHADSNHALALQEVGRDKDIILGDFSAGDDVRQVQFPGEDAPRAFTADDIAYVIGSGQHAQRYLYEVDRNEFMVLPAEWNVEKGEWQAYTLSATWPSDAYDWEQNCASCHTTGFDVERGRWQDDGVMCESCHGPASNHVDLAQDAGRRPNDEELAAIRGAIYRSADPQVCGQCHSRGESPDGHPYPVGYTPGATLSDFFTLVPTDSADHWWLSGHASQPNMQYNEWLTSTHATSVDDMRKSDYAEAACLNCHSEDARMNAALIAQVESGDRDGTAPDAVTVESAQWGVTCTTCHSEHVDTEEPFNLVMEANALCTSCHTNPPDSTGIHHPVTEMFEGVALVSGIDGVAGTHFSQEDGPRCVTCHMQVVPVGTSSRAAHGFRPILPGESQAVPSACAGCHDDLTTTDLSLLVTDTQAAVRTRLAGALARLGTVQKPEADSEENARYQQVVAALNFVQNDGSLGIHNYKYTDALLSTAEHDLALLSVAGASFAPTEAPAPTATPSSGIVVVRTSADAETVASGIRPMTLIVIGFVIAILLIAAFAFFRKTDG